MSDGTVQYRRDGVVAHITFDRPHARNGMTWQMYQELNEACARIQGDPEIRGAGSEAFVAGTDIKQFTTFKTGDDGVAYERHMETIIGAVGRLSVPTMACAGLVRRRWPCDCGSLRSADSNAIRTVRRSYRSHP